MPQLYTSFMQSGAVSAPIPPGPDSLILLSGDAQSGGDYLLLSGDAGSDRIIISESE